MKHIHTIKELTTKTKNIRKEISNLILSLPDNPDIERLSHSNAFVMKSSQLNHGWSVVTHDFFHQYMIISDFVAKTPIEKIYDKLSKNLTPNQSGIYWFPNGSNRRIRLHPQVVKNIKQILEID